MNFTLEDIEVIKNALLLALTRCDDDWDAPTPIYKVLDKIDEEYTSLIRESKINEVIN